MKLTKLEQELERRIAILEPSDAEPAGNRALPRTDCMVLAALAFTNYLTRSVVCAILFVGLGYFGQLERHQLYYVVFAIWGAQLILSPLWLRHFQTGPLEWVWRVLTYAELPKLRREAAVA